MHADTCFPKIYRPSFLPFEQTHVLGPEYHGDEYRYKHSHNAWLAQEYSFKASTLAMYEDYGAFALQWKLGGGCYLMTNNMSPATHELEEEDASYLYLVFAYRNKEWWDGTRLMPKVKRFIRYLEQMPECPIRAIYTRATDCRAQKMKHLRLTGMLNDPRASEDRLDRCYRYFFNATDWHYLDHKGKPFLKFDFRPKYPIQYDN